MKIRVYRDGIRIGAIAVRWRGGKTINGRVAGLSVARERDNGMIFAVFGVWWFAWRLEWWREAFVAGGGINE